MNLFRIIFILFVVTLSPQICNGSALQFADDYYKEEIYLIPKNHPEKSDVVEDGNFATIYYVERDGVREAVVKEFAHSDAGRREYLREKGAYHHLWSEGDLTLNPPRLLNSGEDDDHYYLLIELVKGKSLNQLMKKAGGSIVRRSYHREKLLSAISESARLLRQFHLRQPTKQVHIHAIKKAERRLETLMAIIQDHPIDGIDLNQIESIHQRITKQHFVSGQIHGDVHPGNVFYDAISKQASYIDYANLAVPKRIDEGNPVAADAIKFLITLQSSAWGYGMNRSEIQAIETAFFDGYGRDLLSNEEIALYKIVVAAGIVDLYHHEIKQSKQPLRSHYEGMYAVCKQTLQEQVKTLA